MARDVEIVDAEEVRDLEDRVAVDQQASDDLLLGSLVEGTWRSGARTSSVIRASLEQVFE